MLGHQHSFSLIKLIPFISFINCNCIFSQVTKMETYFRFSFRDYQYIFYKEETHIIDDKGIYWNNRDYTQILIAFVLLSFWFFMLFCLQLFVCLSFFFNHDNVSLFSTYDLKSFFGILFLTFSIYITISLYFQFVELRS